MRKVKKALAITFRTKNVISKVTVLDHALARILEKIVPQILKYSSLKFLFNHEDLPPFCQIILILAECKLVSTKPLLNTILETRVG